MGADITWLEPSLEPPDRFPSPFDELGPHPLARHAAERLKSELGSACGAGALDCSLDGKMVGVLVISDRTGRMGFLRAFSGTYQGGWDVPGFAPPLFQRSARAGVEPAGESALKALTAREVVAVPDGPMFERQSAELLVLRARHLGLRSARATLRQAELPAERLEVLAQESRRDKAERRRLEARHEQERAPERKKARRSAALTRLRLAVSRRFMRALQDCYLCPNAQGETRPLRSLFAPGEPPSGAGDCAAPKLLAAAFAQQLRPVALAEFWWGPPPPAGGRLEGVYYPACGEKCAPLLPFMLQGLEVRAPRRFTPTPRPIERLEILYGDAHVVVVEKPAGLLSVPGKGAELGDSVLTRLRSERGEAWLAHRLDLDTSGILVAALDLRTCSALQAQFANREVEKRYVAWVEGRVRGDAGEIDLPLRVDIHDRPRQVVDAVHGKKAVTRWRVAAREGARTRMELSPLTGRTHQLRVHCAHPGGLASPIVGDRLYGHLDERLMLHAELLSFTHPVSRKRMRFENPAEF